MAQFWPPLLKPICAARTWSRAALPACSSTPCWRPIMSAAPSGPQSRWRRSNPPTISQRWWRGSAPIPRLPSANRGLTLAASHKDQAMASSALAIDVVSDVVCPWCFIGKRLLETAIALKPEIAVDVRFRPYFLNPWVPREGMSRDDYLIAKFSSVENYNKNGDRIIAAANSIGLHYARDKIKRQPNTLDCHRLIYWADRIGNAAQMKQRLMQLYFAGGGHLTNREVLVGAAADCGLDADEVRGLLAGETDVAR